MRRTSTICPVSYTHLDVYKRQPEGILVMGLQGATVELYTASGAQIGRYQITEPEQLIAEQLQSGIYIVAVHKADAVRTFRLIL